MRDDEIKMVAFGIAASAKDGWKNKGASFPLSDVDDMRQGARFIPAQVTYARREGRRVNFVQKCGSPCCWYWEFPEGGAPYCDVPRGSRIYHWDSYTFEMIAQHNGKTKDPKTGHVGDAGPCPNCGNPFTNGAGDGKDGVVSAQEIRKKALETSQADKKFIAEKEAQKLLPAAIEK